MLIYPTTQLEFEERAKKFEEHDPFPSIAPALLSSAEISDYIRVTGMLEPFDENCLKSASYEAFVGGEFTLWDEHGKKTSVILKKGDPCKLPPNSISFVQVEPVFRLPNYIALRFNLRITLVHRGLLLGTGPLVDPGFHGKLWVPLHNLTNEDYDLDTTKALIWIEFTKTSLASNKTILKDDDERVGKFKGFDPKKRHLTPADYLYKANLGNPIRSSIPDAMAKMKKDANDAKDDAEQAKRTVYTIGSLGAELCAEVGDGVTG